MGGATSAHSDDDASGSDASSGIEEQAAGPRWTSEAVAAAVASEAVAVLVTRRLSGDRRTLDLRGAYRSDVQPMAHTPCVSSHWQARDVLTVLLRKRAQRPGRGGCQLRFLHQTYAS